MAMGYPRLELEVPYPPTFAPPGRSAHEWLHRTPTRNKGDGSSYQMEPGYFGSQLVSSDTLWMPSLDEAHQVSHRR